MAQPTIVTAKRFAALGTDFGFYEIDSTGKTEDRPVEPAKAA